MGFARANGRPAGAEVPGVLTCDIRAAAIKTFASAPARLEHGASPPASPGGHIFRTTEERQ